MSGIRLALVVVHITAAAFLFGGSAAIARPLRRTLALGGQAFLFAAEDALRRGKLVAAASVMTLMTGLSLLLVTYGDFGTAPKNFHAALGLLLASITVSLTVLRPSASGLLKLAQAENLDRERAGALLKKMSAGQGIMHLLWLLVLILMFLRF